MYFGVPTGGLSNGLSTGPPQEVLGLPLCGRLLWSLGIREFFCGRVMLERLKHLVVESWAVGTGVRIGVPYLKLIWYNHHMSTFDGVFHHSMSWMRPEVCKLYHLFPTDAAEVYKIRMNANLCALPQRVVLKCGRLCLVTLSWCWLNWLPWLLTWSLPREVVAPRICLGLHSDTVGVIYF